MPQNFIGLSASIAFTHTVASAVAEVGRDFQQVLTSSLAVQRERVRQPRMREVQQSRALVFSLASEEDDSMVEERQHRIQRA
jgi:hypothetical protein